MRILSSLLFLLGFVAGYGQMYDPAVSPDTLYGNEWIDYDNSYFKLSVSADGVYRIDPAALQAAGLPAGTTGEQLRLYRLGREQPLYVSTTGPLSNDAVIEFYGRRSRNETDRFLWEDPEDQLNPDYGLFTDTSAYYLTWAGTGSSLRYAAVVNDLSNLPPALPNFRHRETINFHNGYTKKYSKVSNFNVYYSHFEPGEGFASPLGSANPAMVLTPEAVASGGSTAIAGVRFATNIGTHAIEIKANGTTYVAEDAPSGYQLLQYEWAMDVTDDDPVSITVADVAPSNTNRQAIAEAWLEYDRTYDFGGAAFFEWTVAAQDGPLYLEIENVTGNNPVVYDLDNQLRVVATVENGVIRVQLPAAVGARRLVLHTSSAIQVVNPTTLSFEDLRNSDAELVILTHAAFLDEAARAYAAYRAADYRVKVVDVADIYEEFGYGTARSSLAVRNFANYVSRYWNDVSFFFIIGKGRELNDLRTSQQLAAAEETFFVPTFGFPGSDNLLLSEPGDVVPHFALGRLPLQTNEEILRYLDKVTEHEAAQQLPLTLESRDWTKQIIHIGGSGDEGEQTSIVNGLNNMAGTIESSDLLANVTSVLSNSTDNVSTSKSRQVIERINQGAAMITFFGHSSQAGFAFDIDDPDAYNNRGKYLMMLSLGCFSGNTLTASRSVGERFINYEDKGAILYGATRGYGFIGALSQYGNRLYDLLGNELYGAPVGEAFRRVNATYSNAADLGMSTLVEQFLVSGDPTIRLITLPAPDIVSDYATARTEPLVVRTEQDSFEFNVDLKNLGRQISSSDTVAVAVGRVLPDGTELSYGQVRVSIDGYQTNARVRLPTEGTAAIGLNKITWTIDPDDILTEAVNGGENNNVLRDFNGEAGYEFIVTSSSARPTYPPNYGIVNAPEPELIAVTADYLNPLTTYRWEIDTTKTFDSVVKREQEVELTGGVMRWTPDIPMLDSVVYYWRIAPLAADGISAPAWANASFTYLGNHPTGWSQSEGDQYIENNLSTLTVDSASHRLSFEATTYSLRIKNKVWEADDRPDGFLNLERRSDYFRWVTPQSINLAVFDAQGRFVLNPPGGDFNSTNPLSRGMLSYVFNVTNQDARIGLMDFLESLPQGYLVMAYTAQRNANHTLSVADWASDSLVANGRNLFNTFEALGATQIRNLEAGMVPYIFAFRTGGSVIGESVATDITETLNLTAEFLNSGTSGRMTSGRIGPAASWGELFWRASVDAVPVGTDSLHIQLIGIRSDRSEALLFETEAFSGTFSLSNVSASEFPNLRLQYSATDETQQTPAQLAFWRVTHGLLPDVVFNPQLAYTFDADSLDQGRPLDIALAVENVIPGTMIEALALEALVRDENGTAIAFTEQIGTVRADSALTVSVKVPTAALRGAQQLTLQLNPDEEQAESTYTNNLFQRSFYVQADQINPTLDVTFDGVRILSGDLVSAEPLIRVMLTDENVYLRLRDSTAFDLQIQSPDGSTVTYTESSPELEFEPATGAQNRLTVLLSPTFDQDGRYTLRVQGRDASANLSGDAAYEIDFEVITASTVSNVLNYPNPFTTATRFVYTLTGSDTDIDYQIRIYAASGRVVRELTAADLGPLQIGTHQTEGSWDGTDQYGAPLAKGTYFYRFETRAATGEAIEQRAVSQVDAFFKGGFGKLVIL